MSASKKLKVLEQNGHLLYLAGVDVEFHDEIVAVVEAAEKTLPMLVRWAGSRSAPTWNQVDANELPLRRALAALEEKLTSC